MEGTNQMVKFFLGIVLGFVLAICYYDGFVAREYKDRLKMAAEALIEANGEIIKRDQQIELLIRYIEEYKRKYGPNFFADNK